MRDEFVYCGAATTHKFISSIINPKPVSPNGGANFGHENRHLPSMLSMTVLKKLVAKT
jgi:hypothetical protein